MGTPVRRHLRIWCTGPGRLVAVVTERGAGMSVTNAAAQVVIQLRTEYPDDVTTVIEHWTRVCGPRWIKWTTSWPPDRQRQEPSVRSGHGSAGANAVTVSPPATNSLPPAIERFPAKPEVGMVAIGEQVVEPHPVAS